MARPKRTLQAIARWRLGIPMVAHLETLMRTWQGWIIAIVVVGGLLIPIHYYLPAHRDPHDERFAWRMFSPMRMSSCTTKWTKNDAPLDVTAEFHEAWLTLANRGRFLVLEAMGARLCDKYGNAKIAVDMDCKYIDQPAPVHYGGFNICMVPLI